MNNRSWRVSENLKYLGKQVEITLDNNPESPVIVKGKLLAFCDDGEFEIESEDGLHYCWPMLAIREVKMATRVCDCCYGRGTNCASCGGRCRTCGGSGTVEKS